MSKEIYWPLDKEEAADAASDALDDASDQDQITYVKGPNGRRVAAIVPAEVAEKHEQDIAEVLATPVAGPHRYDVPREHLDLDGPELRAHLRGHPHNITRLERDAAALGEDAVKQLHIRRHSYNVPPGPARDVPAAPAAGPRRQDRIFTEPNRDHPENRDLVTERGVHSNRTEMTTADLQEAYRVIGEALGAAVDDPQLRIASAAAREVEAAARAGLLSRRHR